MADLADGDRDLVVHVGDFLVVRKRPDQGLGGVGETAELAERLGGDDGEDVVDVVGGGGEIAGDRSDHGLVLRPHLAEGLDRERLLMDRLRILDLGGELVDGFLGRLVLGLLFGLLGGKRDDERQDEKRKTDDVTVHGEPPSTDEYFDSAASGRLRSVQVLRPCTEPQAEACGRGTLYGAP